MGKLVRLAHLYPEDFSHTQLMFIEQELKSFLSDVKRDKRFSDIEDLKSLAKKMVETKKDRLFSMVYRQIELALLLPVATASVERVFSAMKTVKTHLRNKIRDEWLNNSLVVFIEKEIFATIDNESILKRLQNMNSHRNQLFRTTKTSVT